MLNPLCAIWVVRAYRRRVVGLLGRVWRVCAKKSAGVSASMTVGTKQIGQEQTLSHVKNDWNLAELKTV